MTGDRSVRENRPTNQGNKYTSVGTSIYGVNNG